MEGHACHATKRQLELKWCHAYKEAVSEVVEEHCQSAGIFADRPTVMPVL